MLNLHAAPMEDFPDIGPDYSAPFFHGLKVIASYVLGGATIVVFIVLIIAAAALALRGMFPERVRGWAGENILTIFIAAAILGSISGIFQWFIGFDFGF